MFRKVMGWIAGKGDDASPPPDALPSSVRPDGDGPQGEAAGDVRVEHVRPDSGRSPVFSSRAVRDAAVVTSAIEAIRHYVAGEEQAEGLTRKLQALSAEQFSFLQISIDPALTAKAVVQAAEARTAAATALKRLLTHMSDGSKPAGETPAAAPVPMTNPEITAAP
ncbi:hypothetical protein, partial [Azospirillum sp. B4]|uniref:hypothetical protein n=1 Tax=Azospirillum sp. B4 TaxID=95605 RepID=UPI0011DD49BB